MTSIFDGKIGETQPTIATTTVISPSSTDEIANGYEQKLTQCISSKILESSKAGKLPIFTTEEKAYLKKKSETILPEVEVITSDPPFTLKKGNTEINIKNAASLVKRMDKVYSPAPKESFPDLTINQSQNKELITNTQIGTEINRDVKKQINSGKNAYEIRADMLELAYKWSSQGGKFTSPEDIIEIAKQFYRFVENKR